MSIVHNVYLREKKMRSGRIYLYLQYYPALKNPINNKRIEWEPLRLQVFPNTRDKREKKLDNINREIADRILLQRKMQLASEAYDFINPYRTSIDAIKYFEELANYKANVKRNSKWKGTFKHFMNYTEGRCTFGEIDLDFVERFKDYLLTTTDTRFGKRLHQNAASAYFQIFLLMLKQAYRNHYLTENLCEYVDPIKTISTHKDFLTMDELKALSETYCPIDVLKRASLFSCFTGLRISDVMNLKWENIFVNQYGGYSIELNTVKNGKLVENPLSLEALEFCGPKSTGVVFKGLERSMLYKELPEWIEDAGITKHITFHCFRHTYATLQIAAGTDIYTVSKMLTHSNVTTTQIYAELVNEKKLETVSKITLK